MIFDTHCHTYLAKQKKEIEILDEIKNSKSFFINNVWTNIETSKHCIEVANIYDFCFASVWIHPCDIWIYNSIDESINEIEKLLSNKKIVAIWECWLDYYRIDKENIILEKEKQKQFFIAQINLAKKYNLPLAIHNRDASNDVFEILRKTNFKNFIMHCFSENLEYAKKLIDFSPNCMISFSWIVTFNSAKEIQETASRIPLKNILIETDSPYLAPVPYRWQENYPQYTKNVLDKIISLRLETSEEIEKWIWDNSLKFFDTKKD